MAQHVTTNLETGKKSVNDDGFITVKLPSKGGISALELTARATNGAGGSASHGILDAIKKIEIGNINGQSILNMSATELYRLNTLINKEAPQLSEGTGAGAVQVVKLPIRFGLGLSDDLHGLDLAKYPNCELIVHYTLEVSGSDGFVTKSFEIDVDARQTDRMQTPNYQGRIRLVKAWEESTQVQNPHTFKIKNGETLIGIHLYGYKSGTADNALIRNITMVNNQSGMNIVQSSFSDLQERRKPIAGSIITSWLTLWLAPGRDGDKIGQPLRANDIEIQLEELVADGAVKIFIEDLRP